MPVTDRKQSGFARFSSAEHNSRLLKVKMDGNFLGPMPIKTFMAEFMDCQFDQIPVVSFDSVPDINLKAIRTKKSVMYGPLVSSFLVELNLSSHCPFRSRLFLTVNCVLRWCSKIIPLTLMWRVSNSNPAYHAIPPTLSTPPVPKSDQSKRVVRRGTRWSSFWK